MSEHTGSRVAEIDTASAIEVDVDGRWDALALAEHLAPFHSFLVQQQEQHWVVYARTPGSHGEDLGVALRTIDDWIAERELGEVSCRVGGRLYQFGGNEWR